MNENAAKAIDERINFLAGRGAEIPQHISAAYRMGEGDQWGWACKCGVERDYAQTIAKTDAEMVLHAKNARAAADFADSIAPLVAAIETGTTDVKDVLALTEGDYDLAITGAIKAKNVDLYNALLKARKNAKKGR